MREDGRAGWTKLVADFESADLSQREFAQERGLSFSNLRYWIYRLRKESRPLVTDRRLLHLIAEKEIVLADETTQTHPDSRIDELLPHRWSIPPAPS